jgi:hypothetical protein
LIAIATGNMDDGMKNADVGRQGNDDDISMIVEYATHCEATLRLSTPENGGLNARRKRSSC